MLLDNPYRVAEPGTLPYDPQPLPATPSYQVLNVLGGREVEDNNYRNACQWALMLFDKDDFISDMPIDAKQQLFELIENNRGTRYAAIRNYMVEAVEDIVREES